MKALAIVGATGKIGNALLRLCLNDGTFDKYFLLGRNLQRLDSVKEEKGDQISLIPFDMQNDNIPLSEEMLQGVTELKVVMLAFSIKPIERIGRMRDEELAESISVNVKTQTLLINKLCGLKEKLGFDLSIVSIDSGAAYTPIKGWSVYCASKAYMSMFIKCLMQDTDVNAVLFEPGVIDTPMQEYIRSIDASVFDQVETFREYKAKGKLRKPEDIARQLFDRYVKDWTATEIREFYTE